jgi:hypothetical protein
VSRRLFPTALALALLVGSAAAFAVTERLKLVPSPIVAPEVSEAFSPVCRCPSARAAISFRLRESDRLTVAILDDDADVVRTLVERERHDAGPVRFAWDGRDAVGVVAPEGTYRLRVELAEQRRTIVLHNRTRLDVTPPVLSASAVTPTTFSPDGDRRADKVKLTYRVSDRATVIAFVDGRRTLRGRPGTEGKLEWYGRRRGEPLRPGLYAITLVAVDSAGNRSQPSPTAVVRIRYIELSRPRVRVRPRARFVVGVATDARSYRWQLGRRRGTARGDRLVLRAPVQAGRYTLRVFHNGHEAAIPVFVRRG